MEGNKHTYTHTHSAISSFPWPSHTSIYCRNIIINALEEWNHQKKLEVNNAILVKIVDQYKTFKDETVAERKLLNSGCNTAKL